MKSCLIFDMDGLLFDTERAIMRMLQEACASRGATLSVDDYRQCIGQSFEMTAKFFSTHYGIADAENMLATVEDEIGKQTSAPLKDGARELLEIAKGKQLVMAIGTSSNLQVAKNYTRGQRIDGYFATIVGGDQVENSKPSPDIYEKILGQLDITNEDAVVLEDSHYGVLAAHRAGIRVVHIPDLFPTEERTEKLCYTTCESLHDVATKLDDITS